MQMKNPLFDDMSRLMTGAMGAAQAAGDEARGLMRAQMDRVVSDMDLASREEVDALKAVALKALDRVEELETRIDELEKALKSKG